MRGSLRDLALSRLGQTRYAVTSNTSFRESLFPECPLIALDAVVTHGDSGRRASRVALYAVDKRFWQFHQRAVEAPDRNQFLLSPALADELSAKPGDSILIRVLRASDVPTESLHGRKDDPGRTVRGVARGALSREGMGEFSLRPQQGPVRAVFVNLDRFQRDLDLEGRVNVALARSDPRDHIRSSATLDDAGIRVHNGMVEHASMMLNDATVTAIRKADPRAKPVLTYLANSIRANGREIPYSIVTAMDRPELQADDQIVLNDWSARDLKASLGDRIELEYYLWDPSGKLITKTASFRYAGVVPIAASERYLAPEYPGISDAPTISDWDPPFPMDLGRIRKLDEEYWNRYRATPKAFVTLKAGQQLWRSRYGSVTGVQTTAGAQAIRQGVDLSTSLQVQDVRASSLQASSGATDFGEYFVYFSFFLVVSALLLAGMFFRFGIEQRLTEIATLRAIGWPIVSIRRLLLIEAMVVAVAGSIIGSIAAFLYSQAVLYALTTWWIDAVGTRELKLAFSPLSIALGIIGGLLMAGGVVYSALRLIGKRSVRDTKLRSTRSAWYALGLGLAGFAMLAAGGAAGFFGAGALLLAAALTWLFSRLKQAKGSITSVMSLGVRYPANRPGRAILCVALIASATFLIIAVDSFRRSGSGEEKGFRYFAESAIPVFYDPNSSEGKQALNLDVDAKWLAFRLRPGDDASCLNLYQPQNPRIIGAPASWITFEPAADGAIPAAVDANTLTYVLHKKLGDMITVGTARLKLARVLHDTVFQSELIIGDVEFQRAFPEEQGFRVFLIDAPEGADAPLETALADYGFDATSVSQRIAAFHQVENTYLTTFQTLGALGLLLGTAGLAAVILRNVLERRRELALLRASGFNSGNLTQMILAENLFLLFSGLIIGVCAAALAVIPTVLQRGGSPPWLSIVGLIAAVSVVGVATSLAAVRFARREPILAALRSE